MDSHDPKLSELSETGDSLRFGIPYGRIIEFEYEITTAAGSPARDISKVSSSVNGRGAT